MTTLFRLRSLTTPMVFLVAVAFTHGYPSAVQFAPKPGIQSGPVTCNEAREVLHQIQLAMERALVSKPGAPVKLPASTKPVSRLQVLDEFDRLERLFQHQYALKPRAQYCNPAVLKFSDAGLKKAIRLIKLGFLEPVAPMVVGPADTLTLEQFSEAVAFFVERWSDMTHLPSTKWSPYLQHRAPMPKPPAGSRAPIPKGVSPPRASS